MEECGGRCLDETGCDYIRGEPRSRTSPGYVDCELLGCSGTLEGTGVQSAEAEIRSRTCFDREPSTPAADAALSATTILVAFACALLFFSLPLCWVWIRQRRQSLDVRQSLAIVPLDRPGSSAREYDPHSIERAPGHSTLTSSVAHVKSAAARTAAKAEAARLEEEAITAKADAERNRQKRAENERKERERRAQEEHRALVEAERKTQFRREQELAEEKRRSEELERLARMKAEQADIMEMDRAQELAKQKRRSEELERLARIEAEQAAVVGMDCARRAREEETARRLEENRRHQVEHRAWLKMDKLAKVARQAKADEAANAAKKEAADSVARRAQEAILAMTSRSSQGLPRSPTGDAVMMSLAIGGPLSPPPRPIAESIIQRHSDRQSVLFDSNDDETPDHV